MLLPCNNIMNVILISSSIIRVLRPTIYQNVCIFNLLMYQDFTHDSHRAMAALSQWTCGTTSTSVRNCQCAIYYSTTLFKLKLSKFLFYEFSEIIFIYGIFSGTQITHITFKLSLNLNPHLTDLQIYGKTRINKMR